MKSIYWSRKPLWVACITLTATLNLANAQQADATAHVRVGAEPVRLRIQDDTSGTNEKKLLIESIEVDHPSKKAREATWLGIATEESSDVLASQLGLNAGEGLVVTYVAPESPAAKAGLEKNDVLVEFESQLLVHPAQFRKLIQMRKEGDTVKLTFYRAGKKETVEATLGKNLSSGLEEPSGELRLLHRQLKELALGDTARDQMKHLQESLAHVGIDKEKLNLEVQRSVEEVRRALQSALRQYTNAAHTFGPAAREFQELVKRGVDLEKDATVVVKSRRDSVRSMVKTDDSGTYVIVASPKKQLTAHDKDGKLLFDGPIETPEEQDKVPRDVWAKVQPMLLELNSHADNPSDPVDQKQPQELEQDKNEQ